MSDQEQKFEWKELKEIWENSSQTKEINIQISRLVIELKDKVSQFEKDSIKTDVAKIKKNWNEFYSKTSQFEKDSIKTDVAKIKKNWNEFYSKTSQFERDSINKDLTTITALLKKFLHFIKKKK
jgi:hypothetical protein